MQSQPELLHNGSLLLKLNIKTSLKLQGCLSTFSKQKASPTQIHSTCKRQQLAGELLDMDVSALG